MSNPQLQETIVAHQVDKIYKKYGNARDVASVWFSGKPYDKAVAANASDGYHSVEQYVAKAGF